MRMADAFLMELDQESKTTRKFLEAIPADQMAFKPHPKSMSAGQLAMHIATIPGMMTEWGMHDEFDMATAGDGNHDKTHTKDEILAAFEKSLGEARERINGMDDARMMSTWTFKMGGKTVMEIPRVSLMRGWMLNHLYHHRGQFGVYLRLTGATVPSSYGPSGDENPMAALMETAAKA